MKRNQSRTLILILTLFLMFCPFTHGDTIAPPALKCVQIFYDHPLQTDGTYQLKGRLYAIGLQNLLGHFPNIQQYIYPVESYQPGQLEHCAANIYLGTYFQNKLPQTFLDDFAKTKQRVAWLGYNIWELGADNLKNLWSIRFNTIATTDWSKKDAQGRPGIYNRYTYKGEMFERCEYPFPPGSKEFLDHYTYDYDISLLNLINPTAEKYVLSWGQYTLGNKKTPYILQNNNHWYVADNPFEFICDGDRYFIFADILFDILDEPPQNHGKKYAFVRYEDVSPRQAPTKVTTMTNMFHKLNIPFAIALIPIYTDPLNVYHFGHYIEITERKIFVEALNDARAHGASFIMHAVSHQYDSRKNIFSGVTAEDFEFWDKENEQPIKEDSVNYILNRLTMGFTLIANVHIPIDAWMTAHYAASGLDNTILGQVFTWNVGRGNYSLSKITQLNPVPENMTFEKAGIDPKAVDLRKKLLAKLNVKELDKNTQLNQIFPYEIYGDYYGRRMIPEDLGNLQPFINDQVIAMRSVENVIKDAKRYRVLRDTWASYFIHDLLLNKKNQHGLAETEGDTTQLEKLLQTIKDLGYEYIDLHSWIKTHTLPKRPEPIEPIPP